MTVDLSDVIKITGAKVELDSNIEIDGMEFLGESYDFDKPLKIKGEIYNNGQTLTFNANVSGTMITECSRCLEEIEVPISFDINEVLEKSSSGAEKFGDVILFEGHSIEIDDIVASNFLMSISGNYLCKEDCKGLCFVCGHNLNDGDCGCDREVVDPRWQALADILNRQDDAD